MEILRTPDDRFTSLPGFDFAPHYVEGLEGYPGMRMHYVDEGGLGGRVFLCLHGEPTWAYLYRRMIPVFTAAGHRAVAPDFFGFGRSDKPVDDAVYTFDFHRAALVRFIERLDLRNIVLVVQDWGGLLGLTLPMDMPERMAGLLVMNTGLGTGDVSLGEGFLTWRSYMRTQHDLDVAKLMRRSTPGLTAEEAQAYAAPFPDVRYKAGVRRFPEIVPAEPGAGGAEVSRRARAYLHTSWDKPTFMAVGMQDPVLGPPVMRLMRHLIRGCGEPLEVADAGHFVQERGEEVARRALAVLAA